MRLLYNLQNLIHSVKICSALSSQYDSLLFFENNVKIVFNLLARTVGFKLGLSRGLYLILPTEAQ